MIQIIRAWMFTLLVVALVSNITIAHASDNFARVSLPKGVSIELPKNWIVLSENQRITLDSAVESGLDLSVVLGTP